MSVAVRRRLKLLKRAARGLPIIAVGAFLAACASDAPQDTFKPRGEYARYIDNLMKPVWVIVAVVFVLVLGGCLAFVIKFRARDDEHYDDMPPQIHGHNALEIGWTIVPGLLLFVIAIFSVAAIIHLNEDPPKNALRVQVVGQQWWWEYRYDLDRDGKFGNACRPADARHNRCDIVTANNLVIPADQIVSLTITSRDVIHSFWAPRLNGKRDAVPNRDHPWKIQADKPGEYVGQCTEFCGLSHAEMRVEVIAVSSGQFTSWARNQERNARPFPDDATSQAAEGYRVFTGQLCSSCHLIEGVNDDKFSDKSLPGFERKNLGGPGTIPDEELQVSRHAPNLTHLMSRTIFAGGKFNLRQNTPYCRRLGVNWADDPANQRRCLDRGNLEAWLRDPPAEKAMMPEGVPGRSGRRGMPNLALTEEQIDQLVAYLSTLK